MDAFFYPYTKVPSLNHRYRSIQLQPHFTYHYLPSHLPSQLSEAPVLPVALAFRHRTPRLLVGDEDGAIRSLSLLTSGIFRQSAPDLPAHLSTLKKHRIHQSMINSLDISPDDTKVYTCSSDLCLGVTDATSLAPVRIWNARKATEGQKGGAHLPKFAVPVSLKHSRNELLLSVARVGTTALWDLSQAAPVSTAATRSEHDDFTVTCGAFVRGDAETVLLGTDSGDVLFFHVSKGYVVRRICLGHPVVAIATVGELAAISTFRAVYLLHCRSGNILRTISNNLSLYCGAVSFLAGGRVIAATGDHSMLLYDLHTDSHLLGGVGIPQDDGAAAQIHVCATNTHGTLLAYGSTDLSVRVSSLDFENAAMSLDQTPIISQSPLTCPGAPRRSLVSPVPSRLWNGSPANVRIPEFTL